MGSFFDSFTEVFCCSSGNAWGIMKVREQHTMFALWLILCMNPVRTDVLVYC